jgi:hypothetical protein
MNFLSISEFIEEVTGGAERWLSEVGASQTVARNLEKFARLRPEGLSPYIEGSPVIA